MSDPFPNGVDCAECLWRDYLAAAPPKTVTQAADAILALINSRPQSPTKAELVAIIGEVSGPPAAADPDPDAAARMDALRAAIREVETMLDSGDASDVSDRRFQAADRRVNELTELVWSTPPRTLADLQERAVIARHCHRTAQCGKFEGGRWVMASGPWVDPSQCDVWHDKAIAHLIHGVLGFSGDLAAPMTDHPLVKEANAVLDAWADACNSPQAAISDSGPDAAHDRILAFVRRLWARQPTSAADIVARAIIFEEWSEAVNDETGELTYLDPAGRAAEGYPAECDVTAEAHLLDAIRKVLGGRVYPKAGGANV